MRLDKGCLLVAHGTEEYPDEVRIPVHEIAVLVLGPRLALTGAVLGAVTANGGAALVLDDRFRPSGLMLPVEGNKAHAERLRQQIERTAGVAPRLWQQIVRAKIAAQAQLVPEVNLTRLVERVEPGDPQNVEAVAARAYWPALFGSGFTRRAEGDTNRALNYGYAVLRALVARAACAAGLHPALGVHHRGWRDTFALADDLMEPARPLVDRIVLALDGPVDRAAKHSLLGAATEEVGTSRGTHGLLEAYELTCQSFVSVLEGDREELDLPTMLIRT